jgi:phosphoenolpyruvate carboxykinase (GTP)
MGDYFAHWLKVGERKGAQLPKIYFVNWFRKDQNGKFIWPGFGDNSRVLKWISDRLDGKVEAKETPIGFVPAKGALDVSGLKLSDEAMDTLTSVDLDVWAEEADLIPGHYEKFGKRLPQRLWDEYAALVDRLGAARSGKPMKAAAARGVAQPRTTSKDAAAAS